MTALYDRCMVVQRHIRQSLVIKLKSCWKVLGSGLKAQEAGEPTFCSWNNSCLLLLFSFSSSFSLETSKHMVDFSDDTKTRQMLFKTPSVTLTVVRLKTRHIACFHQGFPRLACVSWAQLYDHKQNSGVQRNHNEIKGDHKNTRFQSVSWSDFIYECIKCQSCFVLNGVWCNANELATFWPSPAPVSCSGEPQPWSLRTPPLPAPHRRWRWEMRPTTLSLFQVLMVLRTRLFFHAASSPCWMGTRDVISSRQSVT